MSKHFSKIMDNLRQRMMQVQEEAFRKYPGDRQAGLRERYIRRSVMGGSGRVRK